MDTSILRKILFIASYAPPLLAGAPRFMANLLQTLPSESYIILTSFYNIDNISAKIGTWLPGEYIFYDNPAATKETRQQQGIKPSEVATNPTVRLKGYLRRTLLFPLWVKAPLSAAVKMDLVAKLKRLLKRNSFVKTLLGMPLILGQIPLITKQGIRTVKEKNIEIIVGFSDYGPSMVSTYYIHKATNVPFHIYLFDIYKGNLFPMTGNILAAIFEPKLLQKAEKIIVTNKGTKEFYRRRYGDRIASKIEIIHNSVDPKPYLELQTSIALHQPPYTILFTGNIYWAQINSIKNLIKAIEKMTDLNVRLKIYSSNPLSYLKSIGINSSKIELSVAPSNEMPAIQSQTDILFLPLAWHTKSQDVINTATPGKLTEYLIAGKPILIHAPKSSYLVKYAKENDFAVVVDEENIPALQTAIRQLISNQELARRIITNAQRTFFKNHNVNRNIAIFRSLFMRQ